MSITSADIAKMAGVSRSAVSSVLNGHFGKVSLEKREKILALARDLQYRPNRAALILAKRKTNHIGIIGSPFISPIYSSLITHISFLLAEKNYTCSIITPANQQDELTALSSFESSGADGIIGTCFFHNIQKIMETVSIPVLSMSPYPGQYELRVDLREALRISTEHLLQHGYKRVGLLTPDRSTTPLQLEGYLQAVGGKSAYVLVATANPDFEENFSNLITRSKVRAFAVTNDLLAARFLRFLSAKGLRVPEDIALIGFDGNAFDETFSPSLSSVKFPSRKIAARAVQILLEKIRKQDLSFRTKPEMIKPELFLGESCGCPCRKSEAFDWHGQTLILE